MSANNPVTVFAAVMATSNVNISYPGTNSFDGLGPYLDGQLVFLNYQTTSSENGVYVFHGITSPMTRVPALSTWISLVGSSVAVIGGVTNHGTAWSCTVAPGGTLGVTSVTFSQRGATSPVETIAFCTPEQFGADPTGIADSSVAFASMLAAMNPFSVSNPRPVGGSVAVCTGRYLLASGIDLPYYCTLEGVYRSGSSARYFSLNYPDRGDFNDQPSTLIVPSTATITVREGAGLNGLLIRRSGMDVPDSSWTPRNWISEVRGFAGTAITLGQSPSDQVTNAGLSASIQNCTIIGFNLAILNDFNENVRIYNTRFDCTNGFKVYGSGDLAWYQDCEGKAYIEDMGSPTAKYAISGVSGAVVTIPSGHLAQTGDLVHVTGVTGLTGRFRVASYTATTVTLAQYTGSLITPVVPVYTSGYLGGGSVFKQGTTSPRFIATVTNNSGVFEIGTSSPHGLSSGDVVYISGVDNQPVGSGANPPVNTVKLNGFYTIVVYSATQFGLTYSLGSVIDPPAAPAYSSGYTGGGFLYLSEAVIRQGIAYDFSDRGNDGVIAYNLFAHGYDVTFKLGGPATVTTDDANPGLNTAFFTSCASDADVTLLEQTTVDIWMDGIVHYPTITNFGSSSHGLQIKDTRTTADNAFFDGCILQPDFGSQAAGILLNSVQATTTFRGGLLAGPINLPVSCGPVVMVGVADYGVTFVGSATSPSLYVRASGCVPMGTANEFGQIELAQASGQSDGTLIGAWIPVGGLGPVQLSIGKKYAVFEGVPLTLVLPPISSVPAGASLRVADVGGNAGTNNLIITVTSGDSLLGVTNGSYTLSRNFESAEAVNIGGVWYLASVAGP